MGEVRRARWWVAGVIVGALGACGSNSTNDGGHAFDAGENSDGGETLDAGPIFSMNDEDGGVALPDADGGDHLPPPDAGFLDDTDAGTPPDDEPLVPPPPPTGSKLDLPSDCKAPRDSWVGGAVVGSDGRALNVLIGADMRDMANDAKVDLDGVPCEWPDGGRRGSCCGGYSWCFNPNTNIPASGSTDAGASRKWGRCFGGNVKSIWFELYPKNPLGKTEKSRYGSAVHHNQPVVKHGTTDVPMRLPLTYEAGNGNTGTIHGYVTCNGHAIADLPDGGSGITRVRAWSREAGTDCGIQGFSASADAKGKSASLDATYYRVSYLAGGQCNAPSQAYTVFIDAMCGGSKQTLQKIVSVSKGTAPRVDFAF